MTEYFRRCQRQDHGRSAETARIDLFYLALPSFLVCRLLPYGLSFVRRRIGKALAHNSLNGASGTLNVIYAKPHAIGITEIELCEITVQMLFFAMLVDAFHSAFEDRVVAFDGVGVDRFDMQSVSLVDPSFMANIFILAVSDGAVSGNSSPTS